MFTHTYQCWKLCGISENFHKIVEHMMKPPPPPPPPPPPCTENNTIYETLRWFKSFMRAIDYGYLGSNIAFHLALDVGKHYRFVIWHHIYYTKRAAQNEKMIPNRSIFDIWLPNQRKKGCLKGDTSSLTLISGVPLDSVVLWNTNSVRLWLTFRNCRIIHNVLNHDSKLIWHFNARTYSRRTS